MKLSTGDQIASLVVLNVWDKEVTCECLCGNIFKATEYEIMFGKVRSCGCLSYEGEEYIIKLFRYYDRYIRSAQSKGYDFKLTIDEFVTLIHSCCHYCGNFPNRAVNVYGKKLLCNGIDRIDSKKGYYLENVVSSCTRCNYSKSNSPYQSYIEQNNKIYKNIFSSSTNPVDFIWVNPKYYKMLYSLVHSSAKGKGIPFNLSIAQTINLISQRCFYCGEGYSTKYIVNTNSDIKLYLNGIDRIGTNKGYTLNNTLPCCKVCNFMKRDYSFLSFLNQVKLTYLRGSYGII